MKEKKDLSIQVLHIQSWGRPAPRGRGDPHTALRCPVSKERDGFPKGEPQEVRHFRRGAYSKPTKGDCKPGRRIFPEKKLMKGFSAPSGASLPPAHYSTEAHCIVATHYPLHSSPYSLPLTEAHCIVATHFSLNSSPYSLLLHISWFRSHLLIGERRLRALCL